MLTRFGGLYQKGFYLKIHNGSFNNRGLKNRIISNKCNDNSNARMKKKLDCYIRLLNYNIVGKLKISRRQSPIQICGVEIDTNMYTFLKTHFNLDGIYRTHQNFTEIIPLLKERLAILNF